MSTLINKIAQYLIANWSKLAPAVQNAIKAIAGSVIVEYIIRGLDALIQYLSSLSSTVIEAIARFLGM